MEKEKKDERETMMEEYRRLATPGGEHALLSSMAGSFNVTNRSWPEKGKPPQESTGTCERRMLLDGRFLLEEFSSAMVGSKFNGIGITGYDNHTKQFQMIWMDTMGTGIYFLKGEGTPNGKAITLEASYDDPVRGPVKWRNVIKIIDSNRQEFQMYSMDKNGKEELVVETVYMRK